MADEKKKKGNVFHSTPMPKRQAARSVIPQMPSSFDDTVGAAIFDQERSWLRAEPDRADNNYTIITLGMAIPSIVLSQGPIPGMSWIHENPKGIEGVKALEILMGLAETAENLSRLMQGRFDGEISDLIKVRELSKLIDAQVLESFASGISVKADISDKPVILELTIRFRLISGLGDDRPLSIKGDAVINQLFLILGLMLETTTEATRGDL